MHFEEKFQFNEYLYKPIHILTYSHVVMYYFIVHKDVQYIFLIYSSIYIDIYLIKLQKCNHKTKYSTQYNNVNNCKIFTSIK